MLTVGDATLSAWLAGFFWPLLRVGALFSVAPILGYKQPPVRLRLGLAVLIVLLIQPLIPPAPVVDVFSARAFTMLTQQLLIGLLMGFILQIAFAALSFGGQAIAFGMGLGFANMVDPQNGIQVPVISAFFTLLATLLFLLFNGHLILIEILARSFTSVPIGSSAIGPQHFMSVVKWGSEIFAAGLLMALPVIAALLLVNIGMGVITRAAPQMNIFAIGFPITILLGLALLWLTLPSIFDGFVLLLGRGFDLIQQLLGI